MYFYTQMLLYGNIKHTTGIICPNYIIKSYLKKIKYVILE